MLQMRNSPASGNLMRTVASEEVWMAGCGGASWRGGRGRAGARPGGENSWGVEEFGLCDETIRMSWKGSQRAALASGTWLQSKQPRLERSRSLQAGSGQPARPSFVPQQIPVFSSGVPVLAVSLLPSPPLPPLQKYLLSIGRVAKAHSSEVVALAKEQRDK